MSATIMSISKNISKIYKGGCTTGIFLDFLFSVSSFWLAYYIQFNGYLTGQSRSFIWQNALLLALLRLAIAFALKLYRAVAPQANIAKIQKMPAVLPLKTSLIIQVVKVIWLGSLCMTGWIYFVYSFKNFPGAVLIIEWALCIIFWLGWRIIANIIYEIHQELQTPGRRTLIVGSGEAARALYKQLKLQSRPIYKIIGFIDDEAVAPAVTPQTLFAFSDKKPTFSSNLKILGSLKEIPNIIDRWDIEEVIIAQPSASGKDLRWILEHCQAIGVRFKIIPNLEDQIWKRFPSPFLRDVRPEDLLRREPIKLDSQEIASAITGKRILITGAGGSIGSEICRQLNIYHPELMILLDRAENNLYFLELELQESSPHCPIKTIIADINDFNRIADILQQFRPHLLFHAAAYKHVPLMQSNQIEAVKNNVLATRNLARLAIQFKLEKFVLISTDKVVNPTSIMGMTKRAAEMYIQSLNHSRTSSANNSISPAELPLPAVLPTKFIAVRFGNVLGSEGSVVPLMLKQIAKGGPVTVTHPEVKRFFMTIPEASGLVIQAAAMGEGGEIYVLDMGESIKILDLARQLIRLSGFEPEKDIPITFIGLRPGEKLAEKIIAKDEEILPTSHPKIMAVTPQAIKVQPSSMAGKFGKNGNHEPAITRQALDLEKTFAKWQEYVEQNKVAELQKALEELSLQ